ncbi:unnamed protein product [Brachionus calyciflorus]|uniref:EF-hand domain-containing protein n=1 Tax=Brachionus calyciflorus TaxID=104777 RepID=A0A813T6Y0_9BILA|nr:unnamed protein product [Brachionus calyciflorus]
MKKISLLLVLGILAIQSISCQKRKYLDEWFNNGDTNGDHKISLQEAIYLLPKLEKKLGQDASKLNEEVNKYFNTIDTNQDGSIDFNEFKEVAMKKLKEYIQNKKQNMKFD